MTTRARPRALARTESVACIEVPTPAPGILSGGITIAELDSVDELQGEVSHSEIGDVDVSDVQQTPVVPAQPRLKLVNPGCPLRYIPIHIWPEHLKEVQPRTGRRYYPKRSRTFPKQKTPSPLVREYRWTQDEGELPCEDQDLSDTETIRSGDAESVDITATLVAPKRRGWRLALFGAKQDAIQKSRKEKATHFTLRRKSLSLSPLRSDHHPPGLKKRGSLESTK